MFDSLFCFELCCDVVSDDLLVKCPRVSVLYGGGVGWGVYPNVRVFKCPYVSVYSAGGAGCGIF